MAAKFALEPGANLNTSEKQGAPNLRILSSSFQLSLATVPLNGCFHKKINYAGGTNTSAALLGLSTGAALPWDTL